MEGTGARQSSNIFQKWNRVLTQENEALKQKIQELKDKLQQAEAKNPKGSACCHVMQEHQQELSGLKKKHEDVVSRLDASHKFEMQLAELKLEQVQKELQEEKNLRRQGENEKQEAVENARVLQDKLKRSEKMSKGPAVDGEAPEVAELQKMLGKERELRAQAETESDNQFQALRVLSEEMDQEIIKERDLRARAEADKQEAVEIAEIALQKLEEIKKTPTEGREDDCEKVKDGTQQLEDMLREERKLRLQAEAEISNHVKSIGVFCEKINQEINRVRDTLAHTKAGKKEAVEIAEILLKKLEEIENLSKARLPVIKADGRESPKSDVQLQEAKRLMVQAEMEKIRRFQALFEEMDQKLKKEQELRAQTEADKQEAVEIADILLQKLEEIEKISKEL
ncbi:tropomyosin-like [Xiphophorus couchianus]|uniref:tropomyosin-like n=1 Tax=Xiphophorus couchianus TaxID=32473 RepID=UPI001016CD61|nr:tropomyosin-like [Xiphophorus couchianus]